MENAVQRVRDHSNRIERKSFQSPLDKHLSLRPNVAIDLGTASTRVFTHKGLLIEKPSSVPLNVTSDFNGRESMLLYPLQDGVIRNLPAAVSLLQPMLRKSRRYGIHPIAIACVPTTASVWDRQRLHHVLLQAGCSSVEIIQEPLAAAIGAELDVGSEYAQMLIDIGEGVTDLAIIRQGQLVQTHGLQIACGAAHGAVQRRIYERHGVWLSVTEARRISNVNGSPVYGEKILATGTDRRGERIEIEIDMEDVVDAMQAPIEILIDDTVQFLRELSNEVACEIIETGITLAGGGALLPRLVEKMKIKTSLEIHVAADPLHSVIHGAARAFLC